jgi:hypothetical protein
MSTYRIPVRFDPMVAVVFYEEGNGFPMVVLNDMTAVLPDEAVAEARRRWPQVTDPIEVENAGPPRKRDRPATLRYKVGEREVPVYFSYRPVVVFANATEGDITTLPVEDLIIDHADIAIPTYDPAWGEPIAVIHEDEFFELRPVLDVLAGRTITTLKAYGSGRVKNP